MNKKKMKKRMNERERQARNLGRELLAENIAQSLIRARVRRELTQRELAELIETSQPNVSRAESGEYIPSLSYLLKVANVLQVSLEVELNLKDLHLKGSSSPLEYVEFVSLSLTGGDQKTEVTDKKHSEGYTTENSEKEGVHTTTP